MDLVISQLNLKYDEFQKMVKEKRTLVSYKIIYEYFEIVLAQKNTQGIIDQDRQEVEVKKVRVSSDAKLTEKEKMGSISRIEDYSPSCCYDKINAKVYSPINVYREALSSSSRESLIGHALTPEERGMTPADAIFDLFYAALTGNVDTFKIMWIRIQYMFALDRFCSYMDTLHTALIRKTLEMSPISLGNQVSNKIRIVIDDNKGIYQEGKEQLAYNIERISKRMKLIRHLISKDNCSLSDLNKVTHQSNVVTMKSVPEINELFKSKLNLKDDLILSVDTGGYSINRDVYEVIINP